jgi:2-polyprenyl-6-methoxyphenol hydroxylase-like FAD-dependent oxidoreductase
MAHTVIVGAGPAGASLAHLLAHRGVDVTLLERQHDFSREFRGELLMPSGLAALEQMDVHEALESVPTRRMRTGRLYLNGRLVFTLELDRLGGEPASLRAVSQPGLLEMLVAQAATSPRFRFERGVSVRDLLVEQGRIVGVRARGDGGERELRADRGGGADGRSSAVRKHGTFDERRIDQPMDIVWCKMPCPEDWDGVRFYAGHGHLLACYHTWDDTLQVGWVILKGTFGDLRSRGMAQWVEEMANHVSPDLAPHLRAHADAVQKPFLLDAVSERVERWSRPGVLLIGDAAHTMSPVGGQGVNVALRDAIVAANHLVPVLSAPTLDRGALEGAQRAIERERMREVEPIQSRQTLPPRVVLSRAWWGEPVRTLLGFLLRRRFVQSRVLGPNDPFLFGVTDVQLRV